MGRAKALSVVIPGRNEEFMRHTVEDVLAHSGPDTEVIAVCDGYWPQPPLVQNPRLQVIHVGESIGQRAATNLGVLASKAKYVMKLDAHCGTDDGFDAKCIERMEPDMTMIPAMHRFHVFDWMCECGEREYQGAKPDKCKECGGTEFTKAIVWQPRVQYEPTVTWLFDATLHFQYFRKYRRRDIFKQQEPSGLVETMSCIGCCFMLERDRYWELEGMDEAHGSWGQMGTELACKTWLSGGRMVTHLGTWIGHMFRTGQFARGGASSWPYPQSQKAIDHARNHSRDIWMNNAWPKQKMPLSWLVEKFWPVDGWTDADLQRLKESERGFVAAG